MADYKTAASHQVNKWLWTRLKDFLYDGTNKAFDAYGAGKINLTPIIPAQQQPEFTNIAGGAPFIVYAYSTSSPDDYWMKSEQCSYVIYDNDEVRLRAIQNYMIDLFDRDDFVTPEVNIFLGNSKFDFKRIGFVSATSAGGVTQEGGRQAATVVTKYQYTVAMDGTIGSPTIGQRL